MSADTASMTSEHAPRRVPPLVATACSAAGLIGFAWVTFQDDCEGNGNIGILMVVALVVAAFGEAFACRARGGTLRATAGWAALSVLLMGVLGFFTLLSVAGRAGCFD